MESILKPYISRVSDDIRQCCSSYCLGRNFYLIPQYHCYNCFTTNDVPVVYGYCNDCLFQLPDKERDKVLWDLANNRTREWRQNKTTISNQLCGIIWTGNKSGKLQAM